MVLMVGMIVSTATMVMYPVIGFFVEVIIMLLVAAVVLAILVPDVLRDLRRR